MLISATEIGSVEGITDDDTNASPEYYNLQGIRVTDPAPGSMYIMRRGDKVTKVRL